MTIKEAKELGYEIRRGNWYDIETNVDPKYVKVKIETVNSSCSFQRRNIHVVGNNGNYIYLDPEYRISYYGYYWKPMNKKIKYDQFDRDQLYKDRKQAQIEKGNKLVDEFNVHAFDKVEDAEKALKEIEDTYDITINEERAATILKQVAEDIGGPKDWCVVLELTDDYLKGHPTERTNIYREGYSKEYAYETAKYYNEPVYLYLNSGSAWHYRAMKTIDAKKYVEEKNEKENRLLEEGR